MVSQTEDLSNSSSDSNELNLSCSFSFSLFDEHEIANRQSDDEDEPNASVAEDEAGTVEHYMFESKPSDNEALLNTANEVTTMMRMVADGLEIQNGELS